MPQIERSDVKLMSKVKNGDIESFEKLFCRYDKKILHFFYHRTHDYQLSEDFRQETFHKLWQTAGQYKGGKFSAYLFTIAKNICLDGWRKKRRHVPLLSTKTPPRGNQGMNRAFNIPNREPNQPVDGLLQREKHEQIMEAITKLSKDQRLVVILSEYAGLSYQEIACIIESPIKTVSSRKTRAIRKLEKIIRNLENSKK